jgi:hypothetical protein
MTPLEKLAFQAGAEAYRRPSAKCIVVFVEPDPPGTRMPFFRIPNLTPKALSLSEQMKKGAGRALAYSFDHVLTPEERAQIEATFNNRHEPTWFDFDPK